MKPCANGRSEAARKLEESRKAVLDQLKAVSFWREALPALEEMEIMKPARLAAYLAAANRTHDLPDLILPPDANPEKRDLPFYRKLVRFYDDMLSLLPEQEQIALLIFSSNAYSNQRIAIARQALHCEKSQVCRIRNRALDHAQQLLTGNYAFGSAPPLKIGDTNGTK